MLFLYGCKYKAYLRVQILANEKSLLGYYLSGHPLERYKAEMEEFTDFTTASLKNARDGQDVRMIGLIQMVKLLIHLAE